MGSGNLPARHPGPEQKSSRCFPGSSGRAVAEASSKALSKVHSIICIRPTPHPREPRPPRGPGSHCFVNVYHRWKTVGTHSTGRLPTQKCTRGLANATRSRLPPRVLASPSQNQAGTSLKSPHPRLAALEPSSTVGDSEMDHPDLTVQPTHGGYKSRCAGSVGYIWIAKT